jgi:hypothetical protein
MFKQLIISKKIITGMIIENMIPIIILGLLC